MQATLEAETEAALKQQQDEEEAEAEAEVARQQEVHERAANIGSQRSRATHSTPPLYDHCDLCSSTACLTGRGGVVCIHIVDPFDTVFTPELQ